MKLVNGLEEKPYEAWLRTLFSLEEAEWRPHYGLQHSHEGKQRGRCQSLQSHDHLQDLRKWHEAEVGPEMNRERAEPILVLGGEKCCVDMQKKKGIKKKDHI
ncbi:hypothetical protein DUI87_10568 [Hirundo rustica rustica]|uniref:Uncharacterized protein n=1 Tax=Hirundo rustica rustica TaxID=333673 RepID=A0A3M0KIG9_HIRRU|nr:hypothetical protein DUI87_10568 [Hirundo rustica rustica]